LTTVILGSMTVTATDSASVTGDAKIRSLPVAVTSWSVWSAVSAPVVQENVQVSVTSRTPSMSVSPLA